MVVISVWCIKLASLQTAINSLVATGPGAGLHSVGPLGLAANIRLGGSA